MCHDLEDAVLILARRAGESSWDSELERGSAEVVSHLASLRGIAAMMARDTGLGIVRVGTGANSSVLGEDKEIAGVVAVAACVFFRGEG